MHPELMSQMVTMEHARRLRTAQSEASRRGFEGHGPRAPREGGVRLRRLLAAVHHRPLVVTPGTARQGC